MTKKIENYINRRNAANSTGPTTDEGKQRSKMNAVIHGLTGNHFMLQEHERDAYRRLSDALFDELAPMTEMERQLVQKLVDCNMRLNRIPALENNILNFSLIDNTTQGSHEDATECMGAQARAWCTQANSFEKLGRYESRISRQMLQYTAELERLQAVRRTRARELAAESAAAASSQTAQSTVDTSETASFRTSPRVMLAYDPAPAPQTRFSPSETTISTPPASEAA